MDQLKMWKKKSLEEPVPLQGGSKSSGRNKEGGS